MPGQNQDPLSGNQYGPFTDAITGPLTPQAQQAPQISYAPSKAGALAMFANQFLQGLQRGRRTQYERSEMQKMENERNFDSVYQYIQSSPNISPEGKKAAEQAYLQGKFSKLNEAVGKSGKGQDGNPLIHFTKAIAGAVLGPSENKNHPQIDVNSLLSIANDPKYKVNPEQTEANALTAVTQSTRPTPAAPVPSQINGVQPAQVPG